MLIHICVKGWLVQSASPIRVLISGEDYDVSLSQKSLIACTSSTRRQALRGLPHSSWYINWYHHCTSHVLENMILRFHVYPFPVIYRRHNLPADILGLWHLQSFYDFFYNIPWSLRLGLVLLWMYQLSTFQLMVSFYLQLEQPWLSVIVSIC